MSGSAVATDDLGTGIHLTLDEIGDGRLVFATTP